jgi:hypothetical protein
MCPTVGPETHSGGVSIPGRVGRTADNVGRDKTTYSYSSGPSLPGDKAGERAVVALESLLELRDQEIEVLRKQNREMGEAIARIDTMFDFVRGRVGCRCIITINDYLSLSYFFLLERRLHQEFGEYLTTESSTVSENA